MSDFIEKIRAGWNGGRALGTKELDAIYEAANGELFQAVRMAFNCGFLRGQNAEKRRKRKSGKKTAA